ncbi:MAG: Asp-tRNA(Asn)/Glu-tRNA(Gln) amidotransferase subunit GatA [Candidatus Omnitrophota bacterium]
MKSVHECLEQVEKVDSRIHAFVHLDRERVIEQAERHTGGPLAGIPVALKDNICVKDELTTCGSKILEGFKPPYDATVAARLRRAGAILFGKTNMDEFAFGSSCETSCYGPTRNPWDTSRTPGGSSGGSAAAGASGQVEMAIGSDTGGSVRQPAALTGVVGMKPTYGCVSRYGLIAFASSLDQIGPITKDVTSCAKLLSVIAGHDERDSTSVDPGNTDYTGSLVNDIKGMRIGMPAEYFAEGIEPDVGECVRRAVDILRGLGAVIVEISLPHTSYAVSSYYIVGPAEAGSNLARYDGVQYGLRGDEGRGMVGMYVDARNKGFGDEAKRRILLGTYVLSSGYYDAYYLKAQKVRSKIREDFLKAFRLCDCLVTPTSPTPAFKLGERVEDPLAMYLSDVFTIPANLAGIPGISVPCGFTSGGLPVGLQFLGNFFGEETILRAAYTFEQNTDFHKRRPKI